METILKIDQLTKKFGRLTAVDKLSFTIEKGNVYGILGPNGSGKSTTLGIVLNVVNKTEGSFSWFGGKTNTHDALKKVGALIERPNFYPYMTARQNLELVCKIKGVVDMRKFTLFELLIVIAIIGILATVAIPTYFKYVERGYASDAKVQIKNILQKYSILLYATTLWKSCHTMS